MPKHIIERAYEIARTGQLQDPSSAAEASLQLAVFASAPIDRGMYDALVAPCLTHDAGRHPRKSVSSRPRNVISAFDALFRAGTLREARAGALDAVDNSVVDLIENRAFLRPTGGHPVELLSLLHR